MTYEQQVATALRAAADSVAPPVEELVRGGLERGQRRRRRRTQVSAGVAAGLVAVCAAAVVVAPRLGSSRSALPVAPANPSPTGACVTSIMNTPLPPWATTGFSDPAAPQPHAVGERGQIAAVLFGPLSYPESTHVANKVLWVTKVTAQALPLDIRATLEGTGTVVTRQLPTGPGPSYLELPHTGCWHLALSWDGGQQHDELALSYGSPA
jgi:hypothetical protein